MAQIKVNELSSIALDWAVVKCEGRTEPEVVNNFAVAWYTWPNTQYSTIWAHGGLIIEREGINVLIQHNSPGFQYSNNRRWYAYSDRARGFYYGSRPLSAAMRCYVASKLGDTIEVPDELIK